MGTLASNERYNNGTLSEKNVNGAMHDRNNQKAGSYNWPMIDNHGHILRSEYSRVTP